MKQTRTVALARLSCPDFIQFFRYEWTTLQGLSLVARCLYGELVRLSSFKTGEILTSYAQLLALLTPDAPAHGRPSPAPTLKQLRAALDELQGAELVARNKAANEQSGRLTLHVEPRESARTLNANLGRAKGRVEEAKNFLENNKLAQGIHRQRAGFRAGGSRGKSFTTPPPQISDELSTGEGPMPPEPDEPPGPIRLAPEGEKIAPPRGRDSRPAGAGHAPQGDTPTTRAMRARLRQSSAPQGAQPDAPQAKPAASALSDRLRRPRNAVLTDEPAADGMAAPPQDHGHEATDGP